MLDVDTGAGHTFGRKRGRAPRRARETRPTEGAAENSAAMAGGVSPPHRAGGIQTDLTTMQEDRGKRTSHENEDGPGGGQATGDSCGDKDPGEI